jgi:hypothetical protein
LRQRRHDAAGNRVQGHTFDEIAAMTPSQRERLKQVGWLAAVHPCSRHFARAGEICRYSEKEAAGTGRQDKSGKIQRGSRTRGGD